MINRRERYLSILVVGIVGAYGLFVLVRSAFLGPIGQQAAQVRSLNADFANKEKQMQQAIKAGDRLAEWEKISLPPDRRTAGALYHEFLTKLMRDCHVEEGDLTPGKPVSNNNFTRIPFNLTGKMTLENLTDFLYRFYQPNLLHQVRSITVRSEKDPSGKLTVILAIEGLSLKTAKDRDELVPEGQEASGPMLAGAPREQFQLISKKNIFQPYREPAKEKKDPEIDAAQHVVFSACIDDGRGPEAWLYNRLTNENSKLHAGDELNIAGVKGKLVNVSASKIVFEMDSKEWSLGLGKVLRDMQSLAKSDSTASSTKEATKKPSDPSTDQPPPGEPKESVETEEKPASDKPEKIGGEPSITQSPTDSAVEASLTGPGS